MKNLITRSLYLKSQEQDGHFTGYASVFNITDHHGDQVSPGSFSKSLAKLRSKGKMPKMLWQHDSRFPIGIWREIREDEHGLFVHGQILLDLQKGGETYALMHAGILDGLSIGFRPIRTRKQKSSTGRILEEIDLHEISLVTFASNPEAKIIDIKTQEEEVSDLINRLDQLGNLLKERR